MRYGKVDTTYAMFLATCPPEQDGPILMVNLMRYRERADYGTNPVAGAAVSGREADDAYAPLDVLASIGAQVAFVGDVVGATGGSGDRWDRIGVVRYPTRRSFIEMQSRQDFQARHVHKEAGMEFTIVMGCLPATSTVLDPPRGSVLRWQVHPAGTVPGDGRFGEHEALLSVEGTILGDERRWSGVSLTWGDDAAAGAAPVHDGGMVIVTQPSVDHLPMILSAWHAG